MPIRGLILFLAAIACALPASCDRAPAATPIVCVSVLPQAYFVDRIAGGLVDTHVMIPPGASPTTHEPTPEQMRAAADATIYFKVGHPSFPFERTWLDRLMRESATVVDTSAGLSRRDGDPHTWVSPGGALVMATHMEAALSRALPAHRSTFESNLRVLRADIAALDEEVRERLAPHRGETFFVAHPAWGYFADEYGLVQAAVEQGHKPPSPAALFELIEAARASGARVVLVQPQFTKRNAEIIAEEIGGVVVSADPLAYDWMENTRAVANVLAEALAP